MTVERFFELLLRELESAPHMRSYYKFLGSRSRLLFRKNYFTRRLEYLLRHVGPPSQRIWDAGSGFCTTAIFLALNGYRVHGSTLEEYLDKLDDRLKYWSQFGGLDSFSVAHESIFEPSLEPSSFGRIIVQDTLHHIEPIDEGVRSLLRFLTPEGKLIAIEENGKALMIRVPGFVQRGTHRITTYYDEVLKKEIPFGNENFRSLSEWRSIFDGLGLRIEDHEFIRLYPPFMWSAENVERRNERERALWRDHPVIRDWMYMGLNFVVTR